MPTTIAHEPRSYINVGQENSTSGEAGPDPAEDARLVVFEGGPHGIAWTHAARLNAELVQFLA
jgi:pimeloyl-ACP methyl ester carboxylesterase